MFLFKAFDNCLHFIAEPGRLLKERSEMAAGRDALGRWSPPEGPAAWGGMQPLAGFAGVCTLASVLAHRTLSFPLKLSRRWKKWYQSGH